MCPPEDIPEDEEYTYPCECGGEIHQDENGDWVCDKGGHKCTDYSKAIVKQEHKTIKYKSGEPCNHVGCLSHVRIHANGAVELKE